MLDSLRYMNDGYGSVLDQGGGAPLRPLRPLWLPEMGLRLVQLAR